MKVDAASGAVLEVAGAPLDAARVYTVLVDSYVVKKNPVLSEYKAAHPERVPPNDSGRHVT